MDLGSPQTRPAEPQEAQRHHDCVMSLFTDEHIDRRSPEEPVGLDVPSGTLQHTMPRRGYAPLR
ncbi:MAG: hypothetical protein ACREVO_12075 [Steroidobacteraceae bacterium]